VPKEVSERFPSVPISPGLGFTSTLTTDVPFANTVAPGVPAGTCLASEFSVQNPANDEATSVDDLSPMATKKLFPGRFTISLRRRFDAMPLQDIGNRRAPDCISQIGQCALDPRVTPTAILLG